MVASGLPWLASTRRRTAWTWRRGKAITCGAVVWPSVQRPTGVAVPASRDGDAQTSNSLAHVSGGVAARWAKRTRPASTGPPVTKPTSAVTRPGADRIDLYLSSPATNTTRHDANAAALCQDAGDAGGWGGNHSRFADVAGTATRPRRVADWALDRYFQPTRPSAP